MFVTQNCNSILLSWCEQILVENAFRRLKYLSQAACSRHSTIYSYLSVSHHYHTSRGVVMYIMCTSGECSASSYTRYQVCEQIGITSYADLVASAGIQVTAAILQFFALPEHVGYYGMWRILPQPSERVVLPRRRCPPRIATPKTSSGFSMGLPLSLP